MVDRLNTRQILRRRGMVLDSYNCVFCSHPVEEDLFHLFFHCPFAGACWNTLQLLVPNCSEFDQVLEAHKIQLHIPFFMEVIVTLCWSIWSVRNDAIFNGVPPSVQNCKLIFKKEFALVVLRAKAKLHPHIDQWLGTYV